MLLTNCGINLKKLSHLHQDVLFSTMTQLWKLISGPVTLILIPLFISKNDQGFWFTFTSLSALSVFADLGFTAIILQFSAHEYAFLKFENGILSGNSYYFDRIASLFRLVIRWSTIMVAIVFPVIALIGFKMFSSKSDSLDWLLPWLVYLLASSGMFFNNIINSFIQGCEQVAKIQRIIFYAAVSSTFVLAILLILHVGLYALAFSVLTGVLVNLILIYAHYGELIRQFLNHKGVTHNWKEEIFPLLRRYAVSWTSGYFIFQIHTPLAFQFYGPEVAGKVGITISLFTAAFFFSIVWITAKTPRLNILVAEKNWKRLDELFKKSLFFSVITYLIGISFLALFLIVFSDNNIVLDKIMSRFLGLTPLTMLIIGWFLQIFVSAMATYLRAHKEEPYMHISLYTAIYIGITTYLSSLFLPVDYLFLGFLSSHLVFGYTEYIIFKQCRLKWHSAN